MKKNVYYQENILKKWPKGKIGAYFYNAIIILTAIYKISCGSINETEKTKINGTLKQITKKLAISFDEQKIWERIYKEEERIISKNVMVI
uniref:Uncharacterized protein n=1 Tax=Strongyloides venezuelensis TaxID=75913 RepID=A0A0K0G578_STRVS